MTPPVCPLCKETQSPFAVFIRTVFGLVCRTCAAQVQLDRNTKGVW